MRHAKPRSSSWPFAKTNAWLRRSGTTIVSTLRCAVGAAAGVDAWIFLPAAKVRPALAASATSTTTAIRGRKIGSLSPIPISFRQNSAAAEEHDTLGLRRNDLEDRRRPRGRDHREAAGGGRG